MPSDDQNPPNPSRPQSIPLQDLSRPPDNGDGDEEWGGIRTESAGRARALLGNRQAFSGRIKTHGRYERVLAGSSTDAGNGSLDVPHVTTPRNAHQPSGLLDDGELSPLNVGEFQAAMGSVGLTLHPPGPEYPTPTSSAPEGPPLRPIMEDTSTSPFSSISTPNEAEDYFASPSDDRSPLTDTRFLQPISGSQLPEAPGQRHDREHRSSPSFSRGMLGDDLPNVESGARIGNRRSLNRMSSLSIPSLSRSLSTSASPLSTAGTMIRKMSQRVVNLSNEPEDLDQPPVPPPPPRLHRQATLDAPPAFPAMTEYAHDEPSRSPSPLEKAPPLRANGSTSEKWQRPVNPLKGKSLGIFAPDNPLRLWLCEVLVHPVTEPIILVLIIIQTIFLAVDAGESKPFGARTSGWRSAWVEYGVLALFTIYTMEIAARIIVSGLLRNAHEYSTSRSGLTFKNAMLEKLHDLIAPQRQITGSKTVAGPSSDAHAQFSIVRTFTAMQGLPEQRGHSRQAQRVRLARRAFLRHSFNRLDFLAVVSYWISVVLTVTGVATDKHFYTFQMLSCLRILRLLGLTSGTSVILRSLKKAAPLLVHVAFLIGFFWLLFAIVGVQLFKSSFRRSCVYFGENATSVFDGLATNEQLMSNYTQNSAPNGIQFCGGHLDPGGGIRELPYLKFDENNRLVNATAQHKGYLCPQQSLCIEGSNPYNGTVSFDNIAQSLQLVFVIMSANTFSDIMYYTTFSDLLSGAIYFALGMVIMTLWLINLLVAVITSSFQVIREESRTSAFTTDDNPLVIEEEDQQPKKKTRLKRAYDKTYWLWILLIVVSLLVQCIRSADSSDAKQLAIARTEIAVTLLLLVEMMFRFCVDWRHFHHSPRNWVDLAIAVITAIIQLPPIRNSGQPYAWLTFFQIVRIYRVVLAVPITRDLIMTVLGNVSGILNLILFVFLVTFLAAIFAVQIFRGQIPNVGQDGSTIRITFTNIYVAFIGMYQVLSTENWTTLMYNATEYDETWNVAWIDATFFILWYIFANFIILNMFIAVIQENFDVTEDEKRLHQVKAFLQQKELVGSSHGNLSLSTIFRLGRDKSRHKDPIDYGPATIEMFKDTVVRDFLDEQMEAMEEYAGDMDGSGGTLPGQVDSGVLSMVWNKATRLLWNKEPNPFYSRLKFSRPYEDLDPRSMAQEIAAAAENRKRAQRKYLRDHPHYNVSLFLFPPHHRLRRFCQQLVGPGRGAQRIEGVDPVKPMWYAFSFLIYATIVGMVLLACIATPLYQRQYFIEFGRPTNRNWFVWTDAAFATIFTFETLIKIVADGFFWTPNAYFRGAWGLIDGIVLITLWISVGASLAQRSQVSRAIGAVKALRALRLLNVSDSARNTFHSVIILGGWKVISAALVSISLLIPFAIYGLNLFSGQMAVCNDSDPGIRNLTDCTGEYSSTPFQWEVLAPRQAANPYYNFDDFENSLFILFQIVSQEGWIDVMWSAMSSRGPGLTPEPFASQGNAVFFIVFNLLGAVFVLTLFVSVFMRNYTEQTGVAFLTADQRSWLELRKLLRQISPSKRPSNKPGEKWKSWCYRIAVKKHGRWQKTITSILVLHLILLIIEFYPEVAIWERIRDGIFVLFTIFYIINIAVRITGLTWRRFRRSSWDLYSLLSVTGTVITTILDLAYHSINPVSRQLHKLFLVSIALLLIPRNNQLDQLFKTAAASLTAIANLLATWFVLFLVFAIAMTQTLGLTRFGAGENSNLNFRTVPKALILLFRMSCGEGWNSIMEDFATITPPYCITNDDDVFESDCGSAPWARTLFILWNILSMYIFVSMFVSLIYESFSYVYQRSSGLSAVSRDEIRRFKQAWATFDPDGTGYISKEAFPRLLGELSGIFEMRIYDGEHSVNQILEDCKVEARLDDSPQPGVVHGINLAKLNHRLRTINVPEIRRRRNRLNIFSQEVIVSADPDRGISFLSCLMILAHYNVINDSKSLRLEEFLRRRYRLQRVEEEVRRRIVIGFFDTLFWSRQFRRRQDLHNSARMVDIPQFAVPEIFVDDQDGGRSPGMTTFPDSVSSPVGPTSSNVSPLDTSHNVGGLTVSRPTTPDRGTRSRGSSFTSSTTRSERMLTPDASPIVHPRRPSDASEADLAVFDGIGEGTPERSPATATSGASTGLEASPSGASARHRRQQSSVGSQHLNALEAFDNSAWGESIRRSFTLRRNGTRGRGRLGRMEG